MERRKAEGMSLDVHSVASFFVSRVDTEVDKRLDELGRDDLKGLAGLANARAAYRLFLDELKPRMEEIGAPLQRPLWASTGVKDPRYPDTLYVDGLVAPDTVNTMPLETLLAVGDHGEIDGQHRRARRRPRTSRSSREAGHRPARTSPTSCSSRASRSSSRRWSSSWPASSPSARRSSRTARGRSTRTCPTTLEQAVARAHRAARATRTSPAASGRRTRRCGAATRARPSSPTASAG